MQQSPDSGAPVPSATDAGTPVDQGPPSTDAGAPVDQGPPSTDAGSAWVQPPRDGGSLSVNPATLPLPPAPVTDDPAACAPRAVPFPDFAPKPDHPCTEEGGGGRVAYEYDAAGHIVHRSVHTDYASYDETDTYRYDDAGRLVYRSVHNNSGSGHDEIYTSEDDGGVRVETLTEDGHPASLDVTQLWDGKPVEADHFRGADGGLVSAGHTTWLYDDQGRQQYVISEPGRSSPRDVERTVYDAKGRPYFVDRSVYGPDMTTVVFHSFTSLSYFANGVRAHELQTCDINDGPPCNVEETRWEPCGNRAYGASWGGWALGCYDSSADWHSGADGDPLNSHSRWCDLGGRIFDSTESYQSRPDGRVLSGTILTASPPGAIIPLPEHQVDSYGYDDAGHLVERTLDGKTVFHARYDDAGRLIELGTGNDMFRWTYEGCGR